MADLVSATDSIIGTFMDNWLANSGAIVGGSAPAVVTQATEDMAPHPRTMGVVWARLTVQHATGRATALGNRRYEKTGTVTVEIYVPFVDGSAMTTAQRLAHLAKNSYEGERADGVTFPSVATPERGREGAWWRHDVVASFRYTEIKT